MSDHLAVPVVARPAPAAIERLTHQLQSLLGDRATVNDAVREHHSRGESYHAPAKPDIVCFPMSTEEVSAVVRASADAGVPMVPFGAGTSLEGHVSALGGGVSIDLSRMTRILRIEADDLDVTVEAGVTHTALNHALRNTGLFFPVDPGADATLGGMAATRASGTTAVRYGTMRENVLGLTVVLADGRVIPTGGRARKSAAGYDLTRLFVGSEGTLGVITQVTLRLQGRPEAVSAAVCSFPSLEGAVNTVIATIQLGIPVARIELLDEVQMDAVNRVLALELSGGAHAVFRVPRCERRQRERTGARGERSGDGAGRRRLPMDDHARGACQALARASPRLLCGAGAPAWRPRVDDRCVGADLAAGGMYSRVQA